MIEVVQRPLSSALPGYGVEMYVAQRLHNILTRKLSKDVVMYLMEVVIVNDWGMIDEPEDEADDVPDFTLTAGIVYYLVRSSSKVAHKCTLI